MDLKTFGWGQIPDWGSVDFWDESQIRSHIEPPNYSSEPIAAVPNGWDTFGWFHSGSELVTQPRRLTLLRGCSVQRQSLGMNRWHVVSADGRFCASDSYHDGEWLGVHIGERNLRDDAPIDCAVSGDAVLIGHFWAENYAHTLLETASRFWFVETNPELAEMPVVWDLNTPWQAELAAMLCPGRANALPGNHVRFDKIWVPSFYSQIGSSAASVEWLRDLFGAPREPGERRIYVSRDDARERRVQNELEVMDVLSPLGFQRVALGGMSVAAQRTLFGDACVVVMPHGAAMANMLFSGVGTKFIELLPRSYAHPMFGHIAKWSGHWYGRIVCDCDGNKDMTVDIGALRRALDAAL